MKPKSLKNAFAVVLIITLAVTAFWASGEELEKEEPQYGGGFRIHLTTPPPGWDPAKTTSTVEWFILPVYEKTMMGDFEKYGPRGENQFHFSYRDIVPSAYVRPWLIESWEIPDSTRVIFNVRKGVHFQNKAPVNGRELDAEDIVSSHQRIWEVPRFKTRYWAFLDSIEATGKYTVEYKLNSNNSMWKWLLGFGWYNSITPRELVEQDLINQWEYVNGTGPFMLTNFVSDVAATYERNPDYWATSTIDGKEYELPFVDKLTKFIIKDTSAAVAAMRTGRLDWSLLQSWNDVEPLLESRPELKHKEMAATVYIRGHVRFDMPPTGDLRVRRAMMIGIDKQDILDKVYGGKGIMLNWPVQQGMPQFIGVDELPPELKELWDYDPEKAKELLAEAGYPDGFDIELTIPSQSIFMDLAAVMEAHWRKIGIKTKITAIEMGVLRSRIYGKEWPHATLLSRGGLGLIETQAHAGMQNLWNVSQWDDPVFEKILVDGLKTTDPVERDEYMRQMQVRILEGLPELMLPAPYTFRIWWPWVKNYYGEYTVGQSYADPIFARLWIDQALKENMGY